MKCTRAVVAAACVSAATARWRARRSEQGALVPPAGDVLAPRRPATVTAGLRLQDEVSDTVRDALFVSRATKRQCSNGKSLRHQGAGGACGDRDRHVRAAPARCAACGGPDAGAAVAGARGDGAGAVCVSEDGADDGQEPAAGGLRGNARHSHRRTTVTASDSHSQRQSAGQRLIRLAVSFVRGSSVRGASGRRALRCVPCDLLPTSGKLMAPRLRARPCKTRRSAG